MADRSTDALLVVDLLNTYEHEDGDQAAAAVRERGETITAALAAARDGGHHVFYVNDQFGDWTAERTSLIDLVRSRVTDAQLVEPFLPRDDEPLLLKARHSVFFQTPLEYALSQLEVRRVTLIGQVTEQCILYSALDAYIRHFDVRIVQDAVAPIDPALGDAALEMMRRNMHAQLIEASQVGDG